MAILPSKILLIDVGKLYTGGFYYFDTERMWREHGIWVEIIERGNHITLNITFTP